MCGSGAERGDMLASRGQKVRTVTLSVTRQEFHLFLLTEQCKREVFTYTKASSQLGLAQPFAMSLNMDTVAAPSSCLCMRIICWGIQFYS